ncbi:MAG: M1 family metallopeptidase [Stackebrandtia sp.]
MRRALLLVGVLAASTLSASAAQAESSGTPTPDDVEYVVELSSNDDGTFWQGEQTVSFRNTGDQALDTVWIRLWGNSRHGCGDDSRPQAATISDLSGGSLGDLEVDCTAAPIRLDRPAEPGETSAVSFDVSIDVPEGAGRLGEVRGYVSVASAIPLMSVLDARGWHLPPAAEVESYYSLTSDFSVTLRHPSDLEIPAGGSAVDSRRDGDETVSTIDAPGVRDFAFAAGHFDKISAVSKDGVEVNLWYRDDVTEEQAREMSDWGVEAVDAFAEEYGAYPHPELDLVHKGGMEYPGIAWVYPTRDIVVHEVAHQWFYGLVGNDQYAHPWMDEGLAQYAQTRLVDGDPDPCTDDPQWMSDAQRVDGGVDYYYPDHVDEYGPAVYVNASCMLHELEATIGEDDMRKAMRLYVDRHAHDVAEPQELREIFAEVSGRDLDAFWERWRNTAS